MFSTYFWIALAVSFLFGAAIAASGIPYSIGFPLSFIVGIITGILSGKCERNGKN